jgi:deoxyribonuclease-4
MLPNGRRLGAHLPLGSGMVKAADRAGEIGASAIQIFSDNPTAWRRRPSLPAELPAFRERLAALDVAPLAIHAPYLVNLAGPEPGFHQQSIAVLANELRVAHAYGAAFVNVHIGSHRGEGAASGVTRLADGIAAVFATLEVSDPETAAADDRPTLILENGSGGGFGLGATIDELAMIEESVVGAGTARDRFGYCLDTAHLWGAGYPIDTDGGMDEVLAAFDASVGLDRLRMVHLNDSRSELGSRADRHEHIAAGRIGGAGLRRILVHPSLGHVTYYLETPGMEEGYDAVNLERVRMLIAGQPLAQLPPAAFRTRSSKGRTAPPDADAEASGGSKGRPARQPGPSKGTDATRSARSSRPPTSPATGE